MGIPYTPKNTNEWFRIFKRGPFSKGKDSFVFQKMDFFRGYGYVKYSGGVDVQNGRIIPNGHLCCMGLPFSNKL